MISFKIPFQINQTTCVLYIYRHKNDLKIMKIRFWKDLVASSYEIIDGKFSMVMKTNGIDLHRP